MSIHTTTSKIIINASASLVWAALTKPELVKKWQYGSDVISDWHPGSSIRFRTEWENTVYEQWGEILKIESNQSLKYKLFAPRPGLEDKPENYFTMEYLLEETDGKTTLSIIQEDPRETTTEESPDEGENVILAGLKKLVESQ